MEEKTQIIATKQEIAQAIETIITPVFLKKMIAYSIFRLKNKFNIQYDTNRGFRGIMIEDLINDLLVSFISENGRNWNKTKFPDFEKQIFSSLDSLIYNTVNKEFEKTTKTKTSIEDNNLFVNDGNLENEDYEVLLDFCISQLRKMGATDEEILLFEPLVIEKSKRSVIAEELGFLGGVMLILLYTIVLWRGIKISLTAPDYFSRYLSFGITAMITLQAAINIGVVTSVLPTTGLPLPFVSYGGSSLITNYIAIGILLNISRYCEKLDEEEDEKKKKKRLIVWVKKGF